MPNALLAVIRATIAFFVLLVLTKMMGKRQISQLTFFDYVVGISIGSMAAITSVDVQNTMVPSLVGMVTWGALTIFVAYGALKSVTWRKLVGGEPLPLIKNGKVLEQNLARTNMTTDDMMMLLRQQKAFNLSDIETAVFETSGKISVQLKGEKQPVTPHHLQLPVAQAEMPAVVISDGAVMHDTLNSIGRDRAWLDNKLYEQGVVDISDVMLAQVGSTGSLYLDLYEDERVEPHRPHTAKLLHANLLKFQAHMETFSLDTDNAEAKKLYADMATEAEEVISGLQGYLG